MRPLSQTSRFAAYSLLPVTPILASAACSDENTRVVSWLPSLVLGAVLALPCVTLYPRALAVGQASARLSSPDSRPVPPPEARIDINHATLDDLLKVPGMTQTWAARIIRFRPYRTKVDLLDRGVLSATVYDRVKDELIAHRKPQ